MLDASYLINILLSQILHEWKDISDIDSSDPEATGVPCLRLFQLTGKPLPLVHAICNLSRTIKWSLQ